MAIVHYSKRDYGNCCQKTSINTVTVISMKWTHFFEFDCLLLFSLIVNVSTYKKLVKIFGFMCNSETCQ